MTVQQSLGRHHLAGGDDGVRPQDGDAPLGEVLGGFRRRAYLSAPAMAYCTTAPSSMTAPGMTTE